MANAPGSVVDIVSSKMPQDSQKTGAVIANIARAAGVDPNAALTPEQSARVTRLADAYAARTGARPAPAGPAAAPGGGAPGTATPDQMADARRRLAAQMAPAGDRVTAGFDAAGAPTARAQASPADVAPPNAAPMQGSPAAPQGPIVPQVPLPKGFTDPQQAIMALRTEAARLSTNPYAKGQVSALNDWATRIENSIQPLKIGNEIVDPQGRVLYRGQGAANPANIALQRFLQENPTASAAEIQNFVQSGRRSGSAAAQLVNRYLQEHPEATAEDIAAFTRKQQVETTREKVVGAADARALSNSLNKQIMAKNALESFENTAIKNGEILVQLADKVDTTGIPVIERWIRAGRRAVAGDTDVSNFNLQMDLFRTEAAKIITNPNLSGQLTDSARHEMAEAIPSASSAKQIREGFNLLKGDFKRRGEATNKQIELIRKQLRGEAPVESSVEEGGGSVTAAPATGGGGVEVRWEKGPDGKYRKAQ
jgi:hypothetical protein